MLKKITLNRILLMVVLLLIVPLILSAAGNRESNKEEEITLDVEVMSLLEKVESEDLPLYKAKEEFISLEKEYQISTDERNQVFKMMDDIDSGVKKAEECREQVQEQLHKRKKNQTKSQNKDQSKSSSSEG